MLMYVDVCWCVWLCVVVWGCLVDVLLSGRALVYVLCVLCWRCCSMLLPLVDLSVFADAARLLLLLFLCLCVCCDC